MRKGPQHLSGSITERLSAWPFVLKVLNSSEGFDRPDPAVLYLARAKILGLWPQVQQIYRDCQSVLRPTWPPMVKRIAPGFGIADEPGGLHQTSFGLHRMAIVAKSIASSIHTFDSSDTRARSEAVRIALEEHGVDQARPYLEPGLPELPSSLRTVDVRKAALAGSVTEVRQLRGLDEWRSCTQVSSNAYIWTVSFSAPDLGGASRYPDLVLRLARSMHEAQIDGFVVPNWTIDARTCAYAGLRTSRLLIDDVIDFTLYEGRAGAVEPWSPDLLVEQCTHVGTMLARFHSDTGIQTLGPLAPKVGETIRVIESAIEAIESGRSASDSVTAAIFRPNTLRLLVTSAIRRSRGDGKRVLLHGGVSLGEIAPRTVDAIGPQLMGPRRFWFGPAGFDLGYLAGELIEIATAHTDLRLPALLAIRSLVDEYLRFVDIDRSDWEGFRASVCEYAAVRQVEHLLAFDSLSGLTHDQAIMAARSASSTLRLLSDLLRGPARSEID